MITYELAKQLKDAGFPLKTISGINMVDNRYTTSDGGTWLIPTLSELIEACGYKGFSLNNYSEVLWTASNGIFKCDGSIPEEAVANLYLALKNRE